MENYELVFSYQDGDEIRILFTANTEQVAETLADGFKLRLKLKATATLYRRSFEKIADIGR